MIDRDDERRKSARVAPESDKTTKPAGQDVAPPASERVDDEVDDADRKTTQRQE